MTDPDHDSTEGEAERLVSERNLGRQQEAVAGTVVRTDAAGREPAMRPVFQRVDPAAEGDAAIDHQAPRVTAAFGLEKVEAEQREDHASTRPQHPEANEKGYPDKRSENRAEGQERERTGR